MTWEVRQGDCLDVLPRLPRAALVYLDPPFGTGQKQSAKGGEYQDPSRDDGLMERVLAAWDRVDDRGCLVVHLDWRLAPYVRVALDRELGLRRFASEIVWRYRKWPQTNPNFQRVHDTLLRYVKTPGESRWNQLYEPLAPSTIKTWGKNTRQNQGVRKIVTDQPSLGAAMGDVWDIPIVAAVAKERTGYPTQKPERLLSRLIKGLTNPGDLVIDPYCGSGTTVAAAVKLGRNGIGIDKNPQAVEIARTRLAAIESQEAAQ